jgi:hypothetical protein
MIIAVTEEFRETGMYNSWVNIHLKFSFKSGFDSNPKTTSNGIQHAIETPDKRKTVTKAFPFCLNLWLFLSIIIGHRNRHFKDAIKSMYCKREHVCNRLSIN